MTLDRAALIAALDTLGDPDDAQVLAAARTAHGVVTGAGAKWADLISPPAANRKSGRKAERKEGEPKPKSGEIGKIIADLMARDDLSEDAREDVGLFKADHDNGRLDPADENYLRALAGRLG